jgi:isoleucyl-tRNA synthetase
VVTGDFVSTDDGSGIVHIAPAFGADDMEVGKKYGLPVIQTLQMDGGFRPEVTPWAGVFVKDADPAIQDELAGRGLLYKAGTYEHTYPFCWRCDSPLLYFAKETWYIRTSQYRDQLVANNRQINWYPEHIKEGRFGNWLENNVDWALGRDRYWGTPLPIWQSDAPGSSYAECIGSLAELEQKTGRSLTDLDLHRPYVDEITWPAPDGGVMRRVSEVADCWFDSGSMPVAQWHYPFANREEWQRQGQADYICEAIDQTRGWFYTLHAVSTLLFDRPAYKNVICLGHILAEDGSKMSKSKGNVVNPWEVFNTHGADATRWTMFTASRRATAGV